MLNINYQKIDEYINAIIEKRIIGNSFNQFAKNFYELVVDFPITQYNKHFRIALVLRAGKFIKNLELEGKEGIDLDYSLISIIRINKSTEYNLKKIKNVIIGEISIADALKKEINPITFQEYKSDIINSQNNEFNDENIEWVLKQLRTLKNEQKLDNFLKLI